MLFLKKKKKKKKPFSFYVSKYRNQEYRIINKTQGWVLEISKSLPPIRYVYALRTETRYKKSNVNSFRRMGLDGFEVNWAHILKGILHLQMRAALRGVRCWYPMKSPWNWNLTKQVKFVSLNFIMDTGMWAASWNIEQTGDI